MKTKFTLLAIVTLVAVASVSRAQTLPEERVKILPTSLAGTIKLHYAMEVNEPLEITFFDMRHNVIGKDLIKGAQFPHGVSKRYNVSNISKDDFWIQVSSPQHVVTYRIVPSKDKKHFTPMLEMTPGQLMVKAK